MLAIQGYYGFGNLGDDLMLYLLLEQLNKRGVESSFRVLHNAAANSNLIRVPEGVDVEIRPIRTWRDRFSALRSTSALIFGGGTCLHRFGCCGLFNNIAAKILRKKIIWLAIGADDVGEGRQRWKAKTAIRMCNAVSVRDTASEDLILQLSPKFAPLAVHDDLVFLAAKSDALAPYVTREKTPARRTLVIGWRDFSGYLNEAQQQHIICNTALSLAKLCAQSDFDELVVVDVADLVDHETNEELSKALTEQLDGQIEVRHVSGLTMEEKLNAIRKATFAVFARLHGLMLAKMMGLPALGIAYASKVVNLSDRLDRPACLEFSDLLEDPSNLAAMALDELNAPTCFKLPLTTHVESASQHLDFLMETLAK